MTDPQLSLIVTDRRYTVTCPRCEQSRDVRYAAWRRIERGEVTHCRACTYELMWRQDAPTTRQCTRCRETKPLEAFHRSKCKRDRRNSRCADCQNAINREKRQHDPWAPKIIGHRHYSRQKGAAGDVDYRAVIARGLVCYLCGEPIAIKDASFDHVIPLSRGGAHETENVYLTHHRCNSGKCDRLPQEMVA